MVKYLQHTLVASFEDERDDEMVRVQVIERVDCIEGTKAVRKGWIALDVRKPIFSIRNEQNRRSRHLQLMKAHC